MSGDQTDADFMKSIGQAIETGIKLKKVMLKKGLTRARCECPRCGKFIHARLAGRKNHIHMACETPACIQMME